MIRVTHLSTSDASGGAARAAYRLHRGLRAVGADSSMLVEERKTDDPHVTRFKPPPTSSAASTAAWYAAV